MSPTVAGCLYVIVAPSGAGKSSLVNALLEREPDIGLSISTTTRPPRPGEESGREYFFERRSMLTESFRFIQDQLQTIFDNFSQTEQGLKRVFVSLHAELTNRRRVLSEYPTVFRREMKGLLEGAMRNVVSIEKTLETNNPERQLKLGYSIVRSKKGVIRSVAQVTDGQTVEVRVHDGSFTSSVTDITKEV